MLLVREMNTRYFLTPDSHCVSGSGGGIPISSAVEERSSSRPSRNTPPFLIRLAMRISRSRWYSFLRRVFHYQNGSGSELGPNPFDSWKWMLMEFIALAVQIIVTTYVLMITKEERPVWPMRIWVTGYAFGCFLSLFLLFWRYRLVYLDAASSDIEQQRSHDDSRNLQLMQKCKTSLELLFAIWFVMGNVWVFDTRFGSYGRAPKLHVLCILVLAWNAATYSFPFVLFVLLCCCVPLLSTLLGYNMNTASLSRGATDQHLSALPSRNQIKPINEALLITLLPIFKKPRQPAARLEEMNKTGKVSASRLNIEVKEQSDDVSNGMTSPSPGQGAATKPPQSTVVQCLCSPTTHAGSFRCRHHRNAAHGSKEFQTGYCNGFPH